MAVPAAATPLIEQYEGVKARYPGHLILFRVGDFYETFGDDAKLLSQELQVVLTARGPDSRGARLPMAGVPHHAVDGYLARLVGKGYKVALCDQVEDARFAKGLVRREVTRVVTPGTALEDRILPGPDHNFLAAVVPQEGMPGAFAVVDISTGDLAADRTPHPGPDGLVTALAPFAPREILLIGGASETTQATYETILRREFPNARLERRVTSTVDLPSGLTAYASRSDGTSTAVAGLVEYLMATQPRLLPFVDPMAYHADRRLVLDVKTLRHLEIARPMNPEDPRGPTLLSTWDQSVTATGRRTLAFWLRHPLADIPAISERQNVVQALIDRGGELGLLRMHLGKISDLSRIASRLAGRSLRPGELHSLRESLAGVNEVQKWLSKDGPSSVLEDVTRRVDPLHDLTVLLERALPDAGEGGADDRRFRPGYSADLDQLARTEALGLEALGRLERDEQARTGIRTLRTGYNQVFGFYFEVSRSHLSKIPPEYRRKQTLTGAERFTSDRLSEIERTILEARENLQQQEGDAWEAFLTELERYVVRVHRVSRAIGELDALATFAHVARERSLVRPIVDESRVLQIREGRHPVLDRTLPGRFVPNDTDLDADHERLLVLTGPNMSGKSTYMRQVGLLVVLAQSGAFVPARYARVGLVTSLFTRMGFTDEIGRGKSSFMVEMSEVAEILRSADPGSLVLLDEVGRGTSTFDGLALAWATIRHLHDSVRCRTLLATHYHQLTELVASLGEARNAHLAVREAAADLVFLYRLVPGSTDRSYGLHVARLAQLPAPVLREAERLLRELEASGISLPGGNSRSGRPPVRYTQAVLLPSTENDTTTEFLGALQALDLDHMSPMEAHQFVSRWRRRLGPTATEDKP
ncbi:MAG: DNA mismatch repair protein MutS [Thermoplasmata archaeon]